jgi:hypothetical protein
MVTAPEAAPASKKPAAHPVPAPDAPSRTPWIIVGVLVLVALAGGVAVYQIRARQGGGGQIAVPAGGVTAGPDEPAATDTTAPAPSVSATAGAHTAPVVRPVYRPRPPTTPNGPAPNYDDPYGDPGGRSRPAPGGGQAPSPTPPPTAAPHRIFGTDP